jgi:WhiB family redox-sensing transcriptional regulator
MRPDDYAEIAKRLDRLGAVPDDVLAELVTLHGLCFWVFDRSDMPELTGEDTPDRELASRLCAGCPVIDECLEFELREAGETTVGVWGALSDTDRRAVYRLWRWRRNRQPRGKGGDER